MMNKYFLNQKEGKIFTQCLLIGFSIFLGCIVFKSFYYDDKQSIEETIEESYAVESMEIKLCHEEDYLEYMALIQPSTIEQVSFATVAKIDKLYVKENDVVQQGDLLVTLQTSQLEDQLKSNEEVLKIASDNYEQAKTNLNDVQKAYDDLSQEKDQVLNQYDDSIQKAEDYLTQLENQHPLVSALNTAKNNLIASKLAQEDAIKLVEETQNKVDQQNGVVNETQNQLDQLVNQLDELKNNEGSQQEIEEVQILIDQYTLQLSDEQKTLEIYKQELTQANDKLTLVNNDVIMKEELFEKAQNELDESDYDENVESAKKTLADLKNDEETKSEAYQTNLTILKGQIDASTSVLNATHSTYISAKSTYDATNKSINDYQYHAKNSGVVVKVISEEGSIATPLAPILVVASDHLEAQFGISPSDLNSVKIGSSSIITIQNQDYTGKVTAISALPDEVSRTYLVDIEIDEAPNEAMFGELVAVKIFTNDTKGVWLPISVILNDIIDYVYVIENHRAVRKEINIERLKDDQVMVSGLNDGDIVISSNMRNVKSGMLVHVVQEEK